MASSSSSPDLGGFQRQEVVYLNVPHAILEHGRGPDCGLFHGHPGFVVGPSRCKRIAKAGGLSVLFDDTDRA